jgi:hypothetical protein
MKKWVVVLLVVLSMVVAACGKEEDQVKPEKTKAVAAQQKPKVEKKEEPVVKEKSLSDVVTYFKSQGYQVGEVSTKAFQMLGAKDGFGITINGKPIELYQFDPNSTNADAQKNLKDAQTIGKVSMSGFSIPVISNGDFVLMHYSDHPDKDKIIETFKSFK